MLARIGGARDRVITRRNAVHGEGTVGLQKGEHSLVAAHGGHARRPHEDLAREAIALLWSRADRSSRDRPTRQVDLERLLSTLDRDDSFVREDISRGKAK